MLCISHFRSGRIKTAHRWKLLMYSVWKLFFTRHNFSIISKQWNYIKYHCFRWTLYPPDYATFSKQVNDEASQIWCTFLLKGPAKSLVLCSEEKTVFYKYLYWEVHKVSWKQDKQFGERQYQGNNKLKLKLKCNTQMCTLFTMYSPYMRRD